VADLDRGEADVAIRFGTGRYPGLNAERLLTDTIFPVCSPALTKGQRRIVKPMDLRHHTLLHVDWQSQGSAWPTWEMWLSAAGTQGIDPRRGIHFTESVLALQAAIDGQGVALGDSNLAASDLAAGRLIRPFSLELRPPEPFAYWIVTSPRRSAKPQIAAFRAWLLQEAATAQPAARPRRKVAHG
jgi:LysR family glycine cleavage system transcriptional activator